MCSGYPLSGIGAEPPLTCMCIFAIPEVSDFKIGTRKLHTVDKVGLK